MQESPAQIATTTAETATPLPKQRRGFAMMDPDTLRAVCSQGGQTAHALGRAHRFTTEKASQAGKKGGATVSAIAPTWPRSAAEAAKPRRASESGKPHDAKPRQSKHRALDTDRLDTDRQAPPPDTDRHADRQAPIASPVRSRHSPRTSQPWLDCRTNHADRYLTHIPRCGTQGVVTAQTRRETKRIRHS
jgi:general stress protein YciG